jgi:hypothetical protein
MAHVDAFGRQQTIPIVHSATSACSCCVAEDVAVAAQGGAAVSQPQPQAPAQGDSSGSSLALELSSFGAIYTDFPTFANFIRKVNTLNMQLLLRAKHTWYIYQNILGWSY